jgi:DNA repair exonuclease SbcCD ATPase subunit
MALGIFDKVTLLVKAKSHDLLDRQIEANSVPAHEQLIRELEGAIRAESTETIKADVAAKNLHTQVGVIQQHINEYLAGIQANIDDGDPSNDHEQAPMMMHVEELEAEMADIKAQEETANKNHTLLATTLEKLQERHKTMVRELSQLRRAVSQANTDENALKTVQKVKDLTDGVDSAHLGNALAHAQERSQVASAQLEQAVGSIQDSPEALLAKNSAMARLAAMRKAAAGQAAQ